ncbi:MAG: hypothetical protein WCW27_01780 [Patescibacteria group bacterium]|jgi:hypothetical protein
MSLNNDDSSNNLDALREAVLVRRPIFGELLKRSGTKSVFDYAKDYLQINLNPPVQKRQDELIDTFQTFVAEKFDQATAQAAARQLAKYYFVSTSDHNGPLCHPYFMNSNITTALPYSAVEDPVLKYVIVPSCANVSFRNHSFPRGLFFHYRDKQTKKVEIQRLSFFPAQFRPYPVINFRAYTAAEMKKVTDDIYKQAKKFAPGVSDKIGQLFAEVYTRPDVLACKYFTDQVSKTNLHLWKRFFHNSTASIPDVLYLEQETLVTRLILNYHLDQDTTLYHILFDSEYDPLIKQYFDDIMCAFSTKEQSGTYLFWALPKNSKYHIQLWKKGNYLVSNDNSYRLELTPDKVRAALAARELIPSCLMDFFVLSFYYGVKCLGGFNQINYLTWMKNAYIKMQLERGNYKSIEVCARAQTKENNDSLTFSFMQTDADTIIPATGLDLILYGDNTTWETLQQNACNLTVAEALVPLLPNTYKSVYLEQERNPVLGSITNEDAMRISKTREKVKPCAYLTS